MYTREVILMDDGAVAGMQGTMRFHFECGFPVTPAIINLFDDVANDFGGVEMVLSDKNNTQAGVLVTTVNGGKRSAHAWVRKVNIRLTKVSEDDFIKMIEGTVLNLGTAVSTANTFRYAGFN